MDKLLTGLNRPQAEAATHTEGPLLILAGAGSGKTKTLTHRLAYLIIKKGVPPAHILAVTFTNKAANEMRSRVLKLLGKNTQARTFLPFLGTFHGICVRMLRQDAPAVGASKSFVIFDSQDSLAATKQAMRNLGVDEKRWQPGLIRNLISSAKNELLNAEQYAQLASGPPQEIAARVYGEYQKILSQAKALDFDDLLALSVQMLKTQPEILKKWQTQFKYILIDEYQDTNTAQYQLVKMLARAHGNICVVGDDWQSIYSWRGANFKNILDFKRDYPQAKVVKLEQNYRSTEQILEAAQAVIAKNSQRSDKKLWTDRRGGLPVQVWPVQSEVHEGELIVRAIQEAVNSGTRSLGDFAVLYRMNAQSRSLEEAFIRYGVPYKVVGGVRFYERKEIKDIVAYLNFIFQPDNTIAFNRIINIPPRGIGKKSLEVFLAWQSGRNLSLSEALGKVEEIEELTPKARAGFSKFWGMISNFITQSQRLDVADLINLVIKRSGYLDWLNDGSVVAADRIENVQELVSVAQEYQLGVGGLATFLEEVALISDVDQYDEKAEAVTMMTLHSAKGLEFPVVFMAGMEEGVFPHSRSLFEPEQLEEERRLCYVGMTRAREELYLVHANSRLLHGSSMHNPPARFISEISEFTQAGFGGATAVAGEFNDNLEFAHFEAGDLVEHPAFGIGEIVEIRADEAVIRFNKGGKKRLGLAYAPLKKI